VPELARELAAARHTQQPAALAAARARLTPAALAAADFTSGRRLWERRCASCHRLHGAGGTLGPDLSGAGRRDLDSLLTHIVTPSAVVSPDYRLRLVVLGDGRVVAGVVERRTAEVVTLRTPAGNETLPVDEIDDIRDAGVSPMPEGLLDGLTEEQVRDLVAFLMAA